MTYHLYLEGLYFECRPGHPISVIRLSWAISVLQEKCRKEATVVPNYVPSIQSLIIHHSSLIYPEPVTEIWTFKCQTPWTVQTFNSPRAAASVPWKSWMHLGSLSISNRFVLHTSWKLHPGVFEELNKLWITKWGECITDRENDHMNKWRRSRTR
jgi:hypothetical protein